ncbi:D-lyxose/D-mannose family sugar isomerase [Paracoccus sp. S1E-3]|uniref:D-lyxose/D-mannose family sugar isomerase n=1 Tax=Paracoccus sp. S1E-3 TaxID=2756130 RepID=UPI0015EFA54F|nr:D-lyxose/D-mannose family sugar isomerase [Paracoccus sp. S1E-3]MBA4489416.1 D-lyxose/D-mannose family sugar isomerase [Paracoccus sp. S1E-3]
MKRSCINAAIRDAETMPAAQVWASPDFGSGDFDRRVLVRLCTRNSTFDTAGERPHAEKLLFSGVGQESPFHVHRMKLEDIILPGGGMLCIGFTPEGADVPRTGEPVPDRVRIDGAEHPACCRVHRPEAGQGITVPRGMQHRCRAEGAPTFAGEVSQCNDDPAANFFLEPLGGFSAIEEDASPYRLLWNEAEA